MEYTDGIVNPGPEHIGEDFDGSYISEAYNKFSTKRKQGAKESDASYQRYLAHRQEMLNKADGYPLDTLAAAYVDKFGGDEKEALQKQKQTQSNAKSGTMIDLNVPLEKIFPFYFFSAASAAIIRKSVRLIFPLVVLGRDSTNSIRRGYLYGAVCVFTYS